MNGQAMSRRLFAAAVSVLAVLVWTTVGTAAWFVTDIFKDIPNDAALRQISAMARATTLFDANNRPAFTIYRERRIEVPLSQVSPYVIKALLAVEDQRFFDHGGMDVVRVLGAAVQNLRQGRPVQGASTLTQQLARQTFLTREKTLTRKLKEIIVAARLENEFSKRQILQFYLNKVYFGNGLYGIEAAARGYFGKPASEIGVAEAALLAGLVKSPSAYAPTVNLDRAIARRNVVLQTMRDAGVIDATTYDRAVRSDVRLSDHLRAEEPYGHYFKEEVRKQLVQQFGWERVYEGGLKVYTTLDSGMQQAAEAEIHRSLAEIEQKQARRRGRNMPLRADPLQAALVAIDPSTGEVRAMVGGRNFETSHFNRATQARRQPGSAFKPFVYAAALEQGYTPSTLITGLDTPVATPDGEWVPADGHAGDSAMTMRSALRTSSNRAAVQLLQSLGIPTAVRYAERLGVGTVPSVPSLALGSGEVTLLSLTSAYGAFANEGMLAPPMLIRRVETDRGEVLYTANQRAQRAVSEATAFIMSMMMADVVSGGTAWQARRVGFTLPAAGKTGTTNDYRDVWFIGYTPHLVTGVWVGYDRPRTIMINGYAGDLAVPLWARFMKEATVEEKAAWFRAPATVSAASICRMSGKLATEGCRDVGVIDRDGFVERRSMVYTEYFVRGTEPAEFCPLHPIVTIPGAVPTTGEEPKATAPPDESVPIATTLPSPRRGFWSRFLRRNPPPR